MPSPSTIESDQEPAGSGQPESPAVSSGKKKVPASAGVEPPALAPASAEPKEKKKKSAPAGVEVLPRTVAVNGKLVPMPESEQVKLPWQ